MLDTMMPTAPRAPSRSSRRPLRRAVCSLALLVTAMAVGCGIGSGEYRLAPGAKGSIPPSWEDCTDPHSSKPSVVQINRWQFEAVGPGTAVIHCKERKVRMIVGTIARIDIDGPAGPTRYHTFLSLRAYDRKGRELALFDATGIVWTVPEGADYYDFCGHGNTFCDAERVQGVSSGSGTHRVQVAYRGHKAFLDVTFEAQSHR